MGQSYTISRKKGAIETVNYVLPPEVVLHIVYRSYTGDDIDLNTLYSLSLTSKIFNDTMREHYDGIMGHYTVCVLDNKGNTEYLLAGKLHSVSDRPALIYASGSLAWYRHGKLHRDDDKPAVVHKSGSCDWYIDGQLHRDGDEPAVIFASGTRAWYKYGKKHRDGDRPAIMYADGDCIWYSHGWIDREHGKPTIELNNGYVSRVSTKRTIRCTLLCLGAMALVILIRHYRVDLTITITRDE